VRALVFTAAGQVELRDEPAPQVTGDDVLVTVEAAGICGSELHGFRSVGFRKPPLIMGHELAGTVADGSRVVVNPLVTCGSCVACLDGRPQVCAHRQLLGVHRPGAFAEAVAVPAANVHPLPDGISWTSAALIEPLANAVHAWRGAGEGADGVAIVGGGTIGLVCLLVARHHEPGRPVVVVDPSPQRRAFAEQLGATAAANLDELGGTPADRTFDVIVDAVGIAVTRAASVQHLRPGGTAVWLGLTSTDAGFDANDLVRFEKRVLGSFAYTPDDFAAAVAMASQVDLSWGTDVPMGQADVVFMELAGGRTDIVKAVLRPDQP
jgi:threonine dehydrogenase-like Zn-dependent dehydrogenase